MHFQVLITFNNEILICLPCSDISECFVSQCLNIKFLHNVHNISLLDLIMNQTTPVHTFTAYFLMIHNIHLILLPYRCRVNIKHENPERVGLTAPCTSTLNRILSMLWCNTAYHLNNAIKFGEDKKLHIM
jgi:hypothetical protein